MKNALGDARRLPVRWECWDMRLTLKFLIILVSTALLCACSTSNHNGSAEARYRRLERELKKRQAQLDDAKERNMVLEGQTQHAQSQPPIQSAVPRRVTSAPIPFEPSAALSRFSNPEDEIESGTDQTPLIKSEPKVAAAPRVIPTKLPAYVAPKQEPVAADSAQAAVDDVQTSEQRLYSKVLESYRRHNASETAKSVQMLLKTYPESVYADNALYLGGLLSFEKGDTERAAEFMERVLREYPRGNKVVSALFAKAMIQKRQGHLNEARSILRGVRQHYPGSPEAARAVLEIKFIELSANKKREG